MLERRLIFRQCALRAGKEMETCLVEALRGLLRLLVAKNKRTLACETPTNCVRLGRDGSGSTAVSHAKKRENAIEMRSLAPLVWHDDVTEEVEKTAVATVVPQSAHVPSRRTTKEPVE